MSNVMVEIKLKMYYCRPTHFKSHYADVNHTMAHIYTLITLLLQRLSRRPTPQKVKMTPVRREFENNYFMESNCYTYLRYQGLHTYSLEGVKTNY